MQEVVIIRAAEPGACAAKAALERANVDVSDFDAALETGDVE